ncbi:SixA phosphatase family protein [Brachybacterium phenoliresistens]|uniref:Phosphohistidine phosphatase n=1 Tax=Brachybacterium phenoliresistens TaxID=396014 RepID=Z9JY24_9MICO|nr:histidine phosphatase family protein [Brachybacterium phenoliresistens]EWS82721.1 phosphohistidine phosphatase [Brachybacterium phenoliresistens]
MASSDPDSRLLLLMRHGKADAAADSDHDRPLHDKGRAQARMIGEYLESQGVRPSRVLVSDALRTRETWQSVLETMPGFDGRVTFHEDIYHGGPAEVLALIGGRKPKHHVVMVIGHEPTMSTLSSFLADDDSSDPSSVAQARIGLPTGAMSVLTGRQDDWSEVREASMTLHTIVRS